MNRLPVILLLWSTLVAGILCAVPQLACSNESLGQERLAYLELTKVRSQSKTGATYREYRDALVQAREYVGLLRDSSSATVELLRKAISYYDQALAVWGLQVESDFPVDSLRSDESNGAAILRQCPGISRFHYKGREQIYVKDALECIWHQAGQLLDQASADLH